MRTEKEAGTGIEIETETETETGTGTGTGTGTETETEMEMEMADSFHGRMIGIDDTLPRHTHIHLPLRPLPLNDAVTSLHGGKREERERKQ